MKIICCRRRRLCSRLGVISEFKRIFIAASKKRNQKSQYYTRIVKREIQLNLSAQSLVENVEIERLFRQVFWYVERVLLGTEEE